MCSVTATTQVAVAGGVSFTIIHKTTIPKTVSRVKGYVDMYAFEDNQLQFIAPTIPA